MSLTATRRTLALSQPSRLLLRLNSTSSKQMPSSTAATRVTSRGKTLHLSRLGSSSPKSELDEAARVLSASFDDHVTHAVNGSVPDLPLARIQAVVTTSALDMEAWVGRFEEGGKVLGVMLAKPPGIGNDSPNAQGPHTQRVAELETPELRAAFENVGQALHTVESAALPGGVKNAFYMSHIGVAPETQGTGIGTTILKFAVERGRCYGPDVPVALCTMTDFLVNYYTKQGWKTRAEHEHEVNGTKVHWRCMIAE